jgi:hypothetical protein
LVIEMLICVILALTFSTPLLNIVNFPVVRLSMALAAVVYRDDTSWINDPGFKFSGNILAEWGPPSTEDGVQFCVYNQTINRRKSLFIVIRGSSTELDFEGNMMVDEVPSNGTYFHEGFYRAGTFVLDRVDNYISSWPGDIFFVGHSRGGSVSTAAHALAQFMHPSYTNIRSLCFAPPPAIANMGLFTELDIYDHMFSFVYELDPIPRFSVPKVDDWFERPATVFEMMVEIGEGISVGAALPFGQNMLAAVTKKQDTIFGALVRCRSDQSQCHVLAPQGRVYWMRDSLKGQGLTPARIGPHVADQLGELGFTIFNLPDHLETAYLDWISHIGDDDVCGPGGANTSCIVPPICVNGSHMENVSQCFIQDGKEECNTFEICTEKPDYSHCGEDYQWDCAEAPECGVFAKDGSGGSSGSSNGGSSAPGASSGELGSSGSSKMRKCSEIATSDEEIESVKSLRITRAYLGIGKGEGGFWESVGKLVATFSDESRLYHTALWLGTDRPKGILLHYGLYYPRDENESKLFLEGDGVNFRPMTAEVFREEYGTLSLRELRVKNPMRVWELWDAIKEDGPWTVKSYGWLGRNCQHFTDEVRGLLRLELQDDLSEDDAEIPIILRSNLRVSG